MKPIQAWRDFPGLTCRMTGGVVPVIVALIATGSVSASVLAEQLPAQSRPVGEASVARDSASTRKRLEADAIRFLGEWRKSWQKTVGAERGVFSAGPRGGIGSTRMRNLHCHWDGSFNGEEGKRSPFGVQPNLIRSATTLFAVCPDWYPRELPTRADEAANPDAALSLEEAHRLAGMRSTLLASLDSASVKFPGDGWITGQRVRFRLDAQHDTAAESAARSCIADRAWCAGLLGLVLHRMQLPVAADSVFRSIESVPGSGSGCKWLSIGPLLSPDDQRKYQSLDCTAQLRFNERFWWLADPMYSEPGNERRVEHFARKVQLALETALPEGAVYSFSNSGSDAVQAMLLRYGWPSHSWWGGFEVDAAHSEWLRMDANEPYTAPEYSPGKVATSPAWDAVLDPMTVSNSDFVLVAPADVEPELWWPREHFARRAGPIAPIDEGQVAFFRRDSSTIVVVATRIGGAHFDARVGERVEANFVLSTAPDVVRELSHHRTEFGERLVVRTLSDTVSGIAGLEIPARRNGLAARMRFGMAVPAPLSRLERRAKAVSVPLLFQVPGNDVPLPDDVDSVLEQVFASPRLESPREVGVFWESYGFRPGDSVEVAVRLQRITTPGRWQRLGMALGLSDDPNSAVAVTWLEPQPGRDAKELPGLLPVLARRLVVNVSNLIAGDYRLQVTMKSREGEAVSELRVFTIAR